MKGCGALALNTGERCQLWRVHLLPAFCREACGAIPSAESYVTQLTRMCLLMPVELTAGGADKCVLVVKGTCRPRCASCCMQIDRAHLKGGADAAALVAAAGNESNLHPDVELEIMGMLRGAWECAAGNQWRGRWIGKLVMWSYHCPAPKYSHFEPCAYGLVCRPIIYKLLASQQICKGIKAHDRIS